MTPAKFRVIVTRRPKYAYRNRDGVLQAPAPVHLIESGLPTEALLAQIAVAKYADGLPLYRQEAIYARDAVDLDRSLMAQWMGKVDFELQPLADYVLEKIKQGERIFADETTLPTLAPGSGKTQKAWLWAYARDDRPFGGIGPPMVAYGYEDSRGDACVERHLAGFTGILQVDGYAAYNRLARSAGANEGVTLAACFAHVRRRFYELHVNESSHLATQTVTTMAGLWEIEADIRGQDPETRVKARQEKSAAIVAALFDLWNKELPRLSGKSKLAEAIRYATSRRTALERFLSDGRIEIDSNTVERAIRPQTIPRKNALFAGSHGGGRTWATIATLLQTAKMNDVDPHAWLTQTLERIAQAGRSLKSKLSCPGTSKPERPQLGAYGLSVRRLLRLHHVPASNRQPLSGMLRKFIPMYGSPTMATACVKVTDTSNQCRPPVSPLLRDRDRDSLSARRHDKREWTE
ncbi:hypothetical protein ACVWW4_003968 [Bradyrhizobium sp. LB7.1]